MISIVNPPDASRETFTSLSVLWVHVIVTGSGASGPVIASMMQFLIASCATGGYLAQSLIHVS